MKRGKLIALAGLATTGALAYWKYRNLSAEQKENLKGKVKGFVSRNQSTPESAGALSTSSATSSGPTKPNNSRKVPVGSPAV